MSTEPAPEVSALALAARARVGDLVLAHSTAARRLDPPGGRPTLWFPRHVVSEAGAEQAVEPPTTVGALAGHVGFDPDEVTLEVIDPMEGRDERDVTTKRFPLWGDADDLIDILDLRPDGERRFTSAVRGWNGVRPVVEGSQMLGQAVVAGARHCPGRRVVSAHMVFFRGADATAPLRFDLEEKSAGRSFTVLGVTVSQHDRPCASGTLLFDVTAPDVVRHAVEAPPVVGPYDSEPCDMSVTGRDIRVVDGAYTGDPDAPAGPPVLDAWVRFRAMADDAALHAGLLAQFTGHMPIAAALRPHQGVGQDAAHRTLSTAINAITVSFHAEVRADRWMLYHHRSTFAGDGMTHARCRVHDDTGALLASFTVDAMVRAFADGKAPMDERRAL